MFFYQVVSPVQRTGLKHADQMINIDPVISLVLCTRYIVYRYMICYLCSADPNLQQ